MDDGRGVFKTDVVEIEEIVCSHQDKRRKGRGLCAMCYTRFRRANFPGVKEREREAIREQDKKERGNSRYKYHLAAKYKMTVEQYEAMELAQNYCCYLCGGPAINRKRLDVDHSHKTNVIRKLLCKRCNMALGVFDTIVSLEKALKYYQDFGE